jgi:hypothetical protein
MIDPSEVEIAYQKLVSKEEEREFYEAYVKGQPGEELTPLSTDDQEVYIVSCNIRGRTVGGTVLVGPGQTLEAACAVRFAYLIER